MTYPSNMTHFNKICSNMTCPNNMTDSNDMTDSINTSKYKLLYSICVLVKAGINLEVLVAISKMNSVCDDAFGFTKTNTKYFASPN